MFASFHIVGDGRWLSENLTDVPCNVSAVSCCSTRWNGASGSRYSMRDRPPRSAQSSWSNCQHCCTASATAASNVHRPLRSRWIVAGTAADQQSHSRCNRKQRCCSCRGFVGPLVSGKCRNDASRCYPGRVVNNQCVCFVFTIVDLCVFVSIYFFLWYSDF